MIVQRVLSARDEGHAKAGTIFAEFAAGGISRIGDGGVARGGDGRDEFGLQFGVDAGNFGFLQENKSGGVGTAAGELWTDRHGRNGAARIVVGAVHSLVERAALHLFAERAGVH